MSKSPAYDIRIIQNHAYVVSALDALKRVVAYPSCAVDREKYLAVVEQLKALEIELDAALAGLAE